MNQQRPQIAVAALGNPEQHRALTTRMLAWDEPEPGT